MYYVKNVQGNWLLPVSRWYRNRPTFTVNQAEAGEFTEAEADQHLAHPNMPASATKELIA